MKAEEKDLTKINPKRYEIITQAVKNVWDIYKTRDPFVIFKDMGITYSYIQLTGNDFFGCVNENGKYDEKGNLLTHVYINKYCDRHSRLIIAVHELAHIILHQNIELNMLSKNKGIYDEEYEADIFTMEFLPEYQPLDCDHMDMSPEDLNSYVCGLLTTYKDTGLIVNLRKD